MANNWTKESATYWRLNERWTVQLTKGAWHSICDGECAKFGYRSYQDAQREAERLMAAESLPEAATDPFEMKEEK